MRLAVLILLFSVTLVACAWTSPPVPPAPTPRPTPDIDATVQAVVEAALPTPTPTPDVSATVQASVAATIAAWPTPTPAPTPAPSPTPTPTATPTPEEVAVQRLSILLLWFESPPDSVSAEAAETISEIWARDPALGEFIARLPWVADGIVTLELTSLSMTDNFAEIDSALGRQFLDAPWIANGINTEERPGRSRRTETVLYDLAREDPTLASLILTLPWMTDGVEGNEWATFTSMLYTSRRGGIQLTRALATSDWVGAGAARDEPRMDSILRNLDNIHRSDAELARKIISAPWVADGVNRAESRALARFAAFADGRPIIVGTKADLEQARQWLDMLSDPAVQALDEPVLLDLLQVADWDVSMARILASWAKDRKGRDLVNYLVHSMGSPIGAPDDPVPFGKITEQPWFADGLDDQEAALLVTLRNIARKSPDLYNELLTSHHTQHKAISLPLAGDVNIWVIDHSPFPPDEDLLTSIADVARVLEEFLQAPFPTTDIILLIVPHGRGIGGQHLGSHMVLGRFGLTGTVHSDSVTHETAHYYFNLGPRWLTEGGAEFAVAYANDRLGIQSYADRRVNVSPQISRYYELYENIRHYNYILQDLGKLSPLDSAPYRMGEHLLLNVFETIGEEAALAALRELSPYRDRGWRSRLSPTEEEVYDAFLQHAPPDRKEAFRGLYRRLHGGAHAFPATEFSDEHGDDATSALVIEVGEVIEGKLDYHFDFDYFRFKAEEGVKYRLHVEHESLRRTSVALYDPNGVTLQEKEWKSRTRESFGPQILWVAPTSGEHYFAVQNFGGKTGPYTLMVDVVYDVLDDHGDTLASATALPLGDLVEGIVDDYFDFDYFQFEAVKDQMYRLTLTCGTLDGIRVKLYASNGAAPVNWNRNHWKGWWNNRDVLEWVAPSSGRYYFVVDSESGGVGAYRLTLIQTDEEYRSYSRC